MSVVFIILIILSIVSFVVLLTLDKFIFKKMVSVKQISIYIVKSLIFSIIGFVILFLSFDYLHKLGNFYFIPIVVSVLFLIIVFIQYGTKAKFKNSLVVFIFAILSTILYVNFKSDIYKEFIFNIMRDTNTHIIKSHNAIQNRYIALLINTSNENEEITLKVLNDDIKVIEPHGVIKVKSKQKTKFYVVIESKIKDRKNEQIQIEISSGATKKTRIILFSYK